MAGTHEVLRIDAGTLRPPTRTPQGFLRVDGLVARPGIYEYINTPEDEADGLGRAGTRRYELRTEDEVFREDVMQGYGGAPITVLHPKQMLDPKNVRAFEVGSVDGPGRRDGNRVGVSMVIKDAKAIDRVDRRELVQLSPGYRCKLIERSGFAPEYATKTNPRGFYNFVQKDIVVNHLALVDRARGGDDLAIRMDAADVQSGKPAIRCAVEVSHEDCGCGAPEPSPYELASKMVDNLLGLSKLVTTAVDGHQHVLEAASGRTSYSVSAGSDVGHDHAFARNPDGTWTILENAGHTHEVIELSPAEAARLDHGDHDQSDHDPTGGGGGDSKESKSGGKSGGGGEAKAEKAASSKSSIDKPAAEAKSSAPPPSPPSGGGGNDGGGGDGPKETGGGGKKDFGGRATHSSDHADDAKGDAPNLNTARTMRDSMAKTLGHQTSAIKDHGDGTYSFQVVQPAMFKDNRGNIYRSKDEPGAQKAEARGKLESIPEKVVTRHFDKSGAMTVTDHSKGGATDHDGHPASIKAAGGQIHEAQPWKDSARESIKRGETVGPKSKSRSREMSKQRKDQADWGGDYTPPDVVDDEDELELDHNNSAGGSSQRLDGMGPSVRPVAEGATTMDAEEQIRSLKAQLAESEKLAQQRQEELSQAVVRADRAEATIKTLEDQTRELETKLAAGAHAMETEAIREQAERADRAEQVVRENEQRFDAAVRERTSTIRKAMVVMGDEFNPDRMSNREIQAIVVKRLDSGADISAKVTDAYIAGRFDSLVELHQKTARSLNRAGGVMTTARNDRADGPGRGNEREERASAWRNQWKQPLPSARDAKLAKKEA